MAWIRSEDLSGQEILDEVIDGEIVFVQVKNPQDAVVYLEEEPLEKGVNENGLYPRAEL